MIPLIHQPDSYLQLDLSLSPEETMERLRSSVGIISSILFSQSWGKKEPFLGEIQGYEIKMRVRHGTSNGLTRLLYGVVRPSGGGSRLDFAFKTLWWVEAIMRGTWVFMILPVILLFLDNFGRQSSGQAADWNEAMTGLAVMGLMIVVMLGIEILARWMGDRDETRMREHIEGVFSDVIC